MPAKSKKPSRAARKAAVKPAVKKAAPKRAAGRRAVTAFGVKAVDVEAVHVEVMEEAPNLMPLEVEKQVLAVEKEVGSAGDMTDQKILKVIGDYSKQASNYSGIAVKAGASALVYAWGCGCLLNAAKQRLGHGAFGDWRREHIEDKCISPRTSMRYMKLAARCYDVRGLLQWAPTLKQAYIECGILPESPKRGGDDANDGDAEAELARKKEILLAGVSSLQQKMQQCVGVKDSLDKDERRQLTLAKRGIDTLFTQILG